MLLVALRIDYQFIVVEVLTVVVIRTSKTIMVYGKRLNNAASVSCIQSKIPALDATDTSLEKAYAVPSQILRPVPMPQRVEVMTAILRYLHQTVMKMTGT